MATPRLLPYQSPRALPESSEGVGGGGSPIKAAKGKVESAEGSFLAAPPEFGAQELCTDDSDPRGPGTTHPSSLPEKVLPPSLPPSLRAFHTDGAQVKVPFDALPGSSLAGRRAGGACHWPLCSLGPSVSFPLGRGSAAARAVSKYGSGGGGGAATLGKGRAKRRVGELKGGNE